MSSWTDERNTQVRTLRQMADTVSAPHGVAALRFAIKHLEGLPEHWVEAPPVTQSFKRIERIHNGEWANVEFEDLREGDVFRVLHPPGDDGLYTALSRAHPIPGEPGNWALKIERADPPPGLTPRT